MEPSVDRSAILRDVTSGITAAQRELATETARATHRPDGGNGCEHGTDHRHARCASCRRHWARWRSSGGRPTGWPVRAPRRDRPRCGLTSVCSAPPPLGGIGRVQGVPFEAREPSRASPFPHGSTDPGIDRPSPCGRGSRRHRGRQHLGPRHGARQPGVAAPPHTVRARPGPGGTRAGGPAVRSWSAGEPTRRTPRHQARQPPGDLERPHQDHRLRRRSGSWDRDESAKPSSSAGHLSTWPPNRLRVRLWARGPTCTRWASWLSSCWSAAHPLRTPTTSSTSWTAICTTGSPGSVTYFQA